MQIKSSRLSLLTSAIMLLLISFSYGQTKKVYNILDFGAKKDENFNSQKAIQDAIDRCEIAGGGIVFIPAGTYYTSTIYLKSNTDLQLSNNSTLIAIAGKSLYKNEKPGLQEAGDNYIPALLVANKIDNFSITGNGVIKGQPTFYYTTVKDKDTYPGWNENAMRSGVLMERPWVNEPKISLVYITGCTNVLLDGISILNSPNWSCHIQWSRNVRVNGIKIMSSLEEGVNSDSLDIDGCKNVKVSNAIIKTGDDAICLKTTKQGPRSESCEDVTINNCTLTSSSCALKLGTESHSDFKRISFTNCTITNTNRGIGIIIRDGGTVSDVIFSNIRMQCERKPFFWWGNGEAFRLEVSKRNPGSKSGKIENVVLKNIIGTAEGTSVIKGLDNNSTITKISVQNVALQLKAESEKDKRATYGIEISGASGIILKDIRMTWELLHKEPLWRNALSAKNVKGLTIQQFSTNQQSLQNGYPEISLDDVKDVFVKIDHPDGNVLELNGNSKNINVFEPDSNATIINKLNDKKQLIIKN